MFRPITVEDIEFIFSSMLQVADESPRYGKTTVDKLYVCTNLKWMIERPSFIGCIHTDMKGFMFGDSGRGWFDPDFNAFEQLLYVLPEHRGGFLAVRLIKRFEELARERGCIHVRAGTTTQINAEKTIKLYERLGYTREGAGVVKRIN